MKTYDPKQIEAIEAVDGHYLVLAPPGCGKTDILAERIAHARGKGVGFCDMMCLTFTNRASRGMRARVNERVGEEARDLFVGNIHHFCSKYLYANSVVPENTSIIDDDDQTDLLVALADSLFRRGSYKINKNSVTYVTRLATYIRQSQLGQPDDVRLSGERFAELAALAEEVCFDPALLPADQKALILALHYIKHKESQLVMDFDDILMLAYDHMRHNEHRRYRWIQVDEVQDLNPLQLSIIDLLTGDNPTVMYLGDEQQAIFSFMGAKLSLLTVLKQRCQGHLLTLGNNYRAPDYLLDVCNEYAAHELKVDPDLLPRSMRHAERGKMDLILTESDSAASEYARIRKMVDYYLSLDDEERLAILVTKNKEADDISETLERAGISNFKISGVDMFKTKSYKTLAGFYSVLVNDFNFVAWSRLLYGIGAVSSLMASRTLMSRLKGLMMTPSDLLRPQSYVEDFIYRYTSDEFVVFDTETTGLNVLDDDIVQIAACKVRHGHKVPGSDFDIMLHTDREIPAMLGDKVNPLVDRYACTPHVGRAEGLQRFIDYIGDCPLLGHNVTYDYMILKNNVERHLGEYLELDIYDTLHIIKCVEPGLQRYNLEFLVDALSLSGRNSHLADEDIVATKSLVDYCADRIPGVISQQRAFCQQVKTRNIIMRMRTLVTLFDNVRSYLHMPVAVTHRTIADEFSDMYRTLRQRDLIDDLGPKFDVFLRYVQSEWVDCETGESLYDQISKHVYDITSTINEGDLVNSEDLLHDRVFIMTVYKGKGLEFDNVVVLGANRGTYPYYLVDEVLRNPESTESEKAEARQNRLEDARKFYVAISRAKKRLCISYASRNQFYRPTTLTPFMKSIMHHFYFFRGK